MCVCVFLFRDPVIEDANRAIELKNGSSFGGQKIGVKHAMHCAPLEERRSKADQGNVYFEIIMELYVYLHF